MTGAKNNLEHDQPESIVLSYVPEPVRMSLYRSACCNNCFSIPVKVPSIVI